MNKNLQLLFFLLLISEVNTTAQQKYGIITNDSTSVVDFIAPSQGILISQVALKGTTDQNTISTGIGLHVYNTANTSGITAITQGLYMWNGDKWVRSKFQPKITSNGSNTNNTISNFVRMNDDPNDFSKNAKKISRLITNKKNNNSFCSDSSYNRIILMQAH